jgi:hypothetical protein
MKDPFSIVKLFLQYFKTSLKTRISIVYIETWEAEDQAPGISKQVTINKVRTRRQAYPSRSPLTR